MIVITVEQCIWTFEQQQNLKMKEEERRAEGAQDKRQYQLTQANKRQEQEAQKCLVILAHAMHFS